MVHPTCFSWKSAIRGELLEREWERVKEKEIVFAYYTRVYLLFIVKIKREIDREREWEREKKRERERERERKRDRDGKTEEREKERGRQTDRQTICNSKIWPLSIASRTVITYIFNFVIVIIRYPNLLYSLHCFINSCIALSMTVALPYIQEQLFIATKSGRGSIDIDSNSKKEQ